MQASKSDPLAYKVLTFANLAANLPVKQLWMEIFKVYSLPTLFVGCWVVFWLQAFGCNGTESCLSKATKMCSLTKGSQLSLAVVAFLVPHRKQYLMQFQCNADAQQTRATLRRLYRTQRLAVKDLSPT